jgi:hypothetical protein
MPKYSFLTLFQLLLLNTYPYFAISEFKKPEFVDKITQDFIPKNASHKWRLYNENNAMISFLSH